MDLLYALLLIVVLLIGWGLTVVGMPGNWLMVAAAALYAWLLGDSSLALGWGVVAALAVLAAAGELLELLAGSLGVAKLGGSRRGAALALLGSLIGGIAGLFIGLPVPLIGSVLAAILLAGLGALLGALLGELWKGRALGRSWQVARAAFWGRLLGSAAKVLIGSVMAVVAAAALLA